MTAVIPRKKLIKTFDPTTGKRENTSPTYDRAQVVYKQKIKERHNHLTKRECRL